MVYSLDNEETFDGLYRWTKQLDKCGKDNLVKIIVGNKSDLEENRVVSTQSAVAFAMADNAAAAMECSAKENENIELLFQELARKLISIVSGHVTSYLDDARDKPVHKQSDPSAERLLKPSNCNSKEAQVKKSKIFNLPDFSTSCFRKICGIC